MRLGGDCGSRERGCGRATLSTVACRRLLRQRAETFADSCRISQAGGAVKIDATPPEETKMGGGREGEAARLTAGREQQLLVATKLFGSNLDAGVCCMPQGDDAGQPSAVLLAMKRSAVGGSRREEKRQQLPNCRQGEEGRERVSALSGKLIKFCEQLQKISHAR